MSMSATVYRLPFSSLVIGGLRPPRKHGLYSTLTIAREREPGSKYGIRPSTLCVHDRVLAVPEGGRRYQGGHRGRHLPGEHQAPFGKRARRAVFGVAWHDNAGVRRAAGGRRDRLPPRCAPGGD